MSGLVTNYDVYMTPFLLKSFGNTAGHQIKEKARSFELIGEPVSLTNRPAVRLNIKTRGIFLENRMMHRVEKFHWNE